jgi:5'-3' exonuclease
MNKLSTIFEDDCIPNKRVNIVDFSHLAHRCVHVALHENPEDQMTGFYYWKYLIINSIFTSINNFTPDRVIVAVDSKPNWRKEVFDQYKANRKDAKSNINYEIFIPIMHSYLNQLEQTFDNIIFIKVDRCEADDIVAVLTKEHSNRFDEVSIISSDKDFNQLLKYKNVKRYDSIRREEACVINHKLELEMKFLTGCSTDNIKAVRKGIGPKTAQKLINEGLEILLQDNEILEKYKLNKKLIDFDEIPQDLKDNILNNYKDQEKEIGKLDGKKVIEFLEKNKIRKITSDWYKYENNLRKCS